MLLPESAPPPEQLGQLLSYVRFLYIALHRRLFCDEVLSELMPPLEPDGTSLLWESLGRKFTGLSYQEADRLSHENKEFIRALFPQDPLYVTLLPPHVQQLIGQVGPETKGSRRCCARSASATPTGSIRSTAGRTFTPAPTRSRWCGDGGARRVLATARCAGGGSACLVARERTARRSSWRAGPGVAARRRWQAAALPPDGCRARCRRRCRRMATCSDVAALELASCPPQSSSSTTRRTSAAPCAWCWRRGLRRRGGVERRGGAGAAARGRRRRRCCSTCSCRACRGSRRSSGSPSSRPASRSRRHHDLRPRDAGRRRARDQGRRLRLPREAARSRAADGRAAQRARAAGDGARGAGAARR